MSLKATFYRDILCVNCNATTFPFNIKQEAHRRWQSPVWEPYPLDWDVRRLMFPLNRRLLRLLHRFYYSMFQKHSWKWGWGVWVQTPGGKICKLLVIRNQQAFNDQSFIIFISFWMHRKCIKLVSTGQEYNALDIKVKLKLSMYDTQQRPM